VNTTDATTTVQWTVTGEGIGDNWEGLAWDLGGNFLYGAESSKLFRWNPTTRIAERLCGKGFLPDDTEALDFRPDGVLVGGWHNALDDTLRVFQIDFVNCVITTTDYTIPFNDVESVAFDFTGPVQLTPTVPPPTPTVPTPTPIVPTPTRAPIAGQDKLVAQVYIDFQCNGSFEWGVDRPLANVPVTLQFPDGSSTSQQTAELGMAYFAGISAVNGVTVRVDLPASYGSHAVRNCANSPTTITLAPEDFEPGVINHIQVQFRAELWDGTSGPQPTTQPSPQPPPPTNPPPPPGF
jgi:hypothetical protein